MLAAIEHASWRISILGATADPTASWAAQAVRNLVMDLEDVGCGARFLIWNQPHLLHALREFEHFYNEHQPHQGITNTRPPQPLPEPLADPDRIACPDIRRRDRLGGVLHKYQNAV